VCAGESRAPVKTIRNWPSKCKASAKANKIHNRNASREREIMNVTVRASSRGATLSHRHTHTHTATLTYTVKQRSLAGQKIKIVLVADYYCKNAHSSATYPHKAAAAPFSLCFRFVFPFFMHTNTNTRTLGYTMYACMHAVAAGMFQNV